MPTTVYGAHGFPALSSHLSVFFSNTDIQHSARGQAREQGQTIPGGLSVPEAWLTDERRERISRLSVY